MILVIAGFCSLATGIPLLVLKKGWGLPLDYMKHDWLCNRKENISTIKMVDGNRVLPRRQRRRDST